MARYKNRVTLMPVKGDGLTINDRTERMLELYEAMVQGSETLMAFFQRYPGELKRQTPSLLASGITRTQINELADYLEASV